jgi:hypothetical protein
MGSAQLKTGPTHFKTMVQLDVPQGRNGSATRKAGRKVATASDATFLYVWNMTE